MKCSNCNASLVVKLFGPYKIHACNDCKGVWIDGSELFNILSNEDNVEHLKNLPAYEKGGGKALENRGCPVCKDIELSAKLVKGIEIDICRKCRGVYFDRDELQQLVPKCVDLNTQMGAGQGISEGILFILYMIFQG